MRVCDVNFKLFILNGLRDVMEGEIYIEMCWELFCQSNSFGREVG